MADAGIDNLKDGQNRGTAFDQLTDLWLVVVIRLPGHSLGPFID